MGQRISTVIAPLYQQQHQQVGATSGWTVIAPLYQQQHQQVGATSGWTVRPAADQTAAESDWNRRNRRPDIDERARQEIKWNTLKKQLVDDQWRINVFRKKLDTSYDDSLDDDDLAEIGLPATKPKVPRAVGTMITLGKTTKTTITPATTATAAAAAAETAVPLAVGLSLGNAGGLRSWARWPTVLRPTITAPAEPAPTRPDEVYFAFRGGQPNHHWGALTIIKAKVPAHANLRRDVNAETGLERFELDVWEPTAYAPVHDRLAHGNRSHSEAKHFTSKPIEDLQWTTDTKTHLEDKVFGLGQQRKVQIVFSEGVTHYTVKGVNNAFRTPDDALKDARKLAWIF